MLIIKMCTKASIMTFRRNIFNLSWNLILVTFSTYLIFPLTPTRGQKGIIDGIRPLSKPLLIKASHSRHLSNNRLILYNFFSQKRSYDQQKAAYCTSFSFSTSLYFSFSHITSSEKKRRKNDVCEQKPINYSELRLSKEEREKEFRERPRIEGLYTHARIT